MNQEVVRTIALIVLFGFIIFSILGIKKFTCIPAVFCSIYLVVFLFPVSQKYLFLGIETAIIFLRDTIFSMSLWHIIMALGIIFLFIAYHLYLPRYLTNLEEEAQNYCYYKPLIKEDTGFCTSQEKYYDSKYKSLNCYHFLNILVFLLFLLTLALCFYNPRVLVLLFIFEEIFIQLKNGFSKRTGIYFFPFMEILNYIERQEDKQIFNRHYFQQVFWSLILCTSLFALFSWIGMTVDLLIVVLIFIVFHVFWYYQYKQAFEEHI